MKPPAMQTFKEWEGAVSPARTGDPLWAVQAYRLSLYILECHTFDRQTCAQLKQAAALSQLTQALGSISANLAEGYSRLSIADRTRFYGYALGSTREAIAWYDTLRIELGQRVDERQDTLIQVRRLLLATLRKIRPEDATTRLRDSLPRSPNPASRDD